MWVSSFAISWLIGMLARTFLKINKNLQKPSGAELMAKKKRQQINILICEAIKNGNKNRIINLSSHLVANRATLSLETAHSLPR